MKLKFFKKNLIGTEYTCELTEELDKQLFGHFVCCESYKVYILDDRDSYDPFTLALRVPGCTIGYIDVNEKWEIVEAKINDYALERFANNPNETLKQFIGQKLEVEE